MSNDQYPPGYDPKKDAIHLESYNKAWLDLAAQEIVILKSAFFQYHLTPYVSDIQHVGSTAIPHLMAKPVIDIFIGIQPFNQAAHFIDPIKALGYLYWDTNPNPHPLLFF